MRAIKQDERIEVATLLVRKPLEEWKQEDYVPKLDFIARDNFEDISDLKDRLMGYDAFFCTLGIEIKNGEEMFRKVDYQYPLNFAGLAKECKVRYFGILTSQSSDPKSRIMYLRVKGEVEEAISKLELPIFGVFKPGLIMNRDNERTAEKIFSYVPFWPKIDARLLGKSMAEHAIEQLKTQQNQHSVKFELNNSQLLDYIKERDLKI